VKLGLQTVPGVSEVASFGGFEKQYQISIDPHKLNYYNIPLSQVLKAVKSNNNDVGGRKFEMNGTGYIVRGLGYIKSLADVENIAVGVIKTIPVRVKDIASVQMGGDERLGIFDQDGQGEAVGGIVVMRYGENADRVIHAVKDKMADIQKGLPPGVTFKIAYDRSELIESAVKSVKHTLIEELITVSIIVILFLFSWRSALSIIIQIPITIAASFILLNAFGISSNIMSLTGIALAIGVIVDNGIVMVENSHRNLSIAQQKEQS
jgi:Cu(I)/Ag(I) efflux system membrane protein CusA/SilA